MVCLAQTATAAESERRILSRKQCRDMGRGKVFGMQLEVAEAEALVEQVVALEADLEVAVVEEAVEASFSCNPEKSRVSSCR